jgi:hypothetical protein
MGPYELLEKVVEPFERLDIPYLVTGSVAAMAYGEPRMTNDIDIVGGQGRGRWFLRCITLFSHKLFLLQHDDLWLRRPTI